MDLQEALNVWIGTGMTVLVICLGAGMAAMYFWLCKLEEKLDGVETSQNLLYEDGECARRISQCRYSELKNQNLELRANLDALDERCKRERQSLSAILNTAGDCIAGRVVIRVGEKQEGDGITKPS